jgi:Spy/CpxP family protein refolding chaperone
MKLTSLALLAALAVVPASVVACGGSVEAPQTAGLSKAPVGQNTHGFVKVAGEALGEVPLKNEQRTELEKIASEADQRHASMADGRKELANAIADQVEKGTIDRAALQPKIDRVVADMEKVRPADQAAMARVHAILDADQRNAFVDALEKKMHEAREHHEGRGHGGFGHMKQLADELNLTDAQKDQIKTVFMDAHKEHAKDAKEHVGGEGAHRGPHHRDGQKAHGGHGGHGGPGGKHGLERFRDDTWDPTVGGPHGDMKEHAAQGTTRMLGLAEKILPILTPEQRKIAADKLRAMSAKGETPFVH